MAHPPSNRAVLNGSSSGPRRAQAQTCDCQPLLGGAVTDSLMKNAHLLHVQRTLSRLERAVQKEGLSKHAGGHLGVSLQQSKALLEWELILEPLRDVGDSIEQFRRYLGERGTGIVLEHAHQQLMIQELGLEGSLWHDAQPPREACPSCSRALQSLLHIVHKGSKGLLVYRPGVRCAEARSSSQCVGTTSSLQSLAPPRYALVCVQR